MARRGRCSRCKHVKALRTRVCEECKGWRRKASERAAAARVAAGAYARQDGPSPLRRGAPPKCQSCQGEATCGSRCVSCWFKQMAKRAAGSRAHTEALRALFHAQQGRCALTGADLTPGVNASLDHKVPRSRGGSDAVSNLQWVHLSVNYAKSVLTDGEFVALCAAVTRRARGRRRR